jgi:restriction system protein
VGIKPVRELFGVMASDEIQNGYFVTTGEFTEEAARFAQGKEMTLVTGRDLLAKINALPESARSAMLHQVTDGDYTTPTCPRCDVKMVLRTGSDGDFWGCPNYSRRPRCRQTFKLRET